MEHAVGGKWLELLKEIVPNEGAPDQLAEIAHSPAAPTDSHGLTSE